jgi:hypothetical protein
MANPRGRLGHLFDPAVHVVGGNADVTFQFRNLRGGDAGRFFWCFVAFEPSGCEAWSGRLVGQPTP